jgi:outer membrane protein assembly factor BamB
MRGQLEVPQPITSSLATTGSLVVGVDEAGVLTAFQLPELKRLDALEQPLTGRCVWGPAQVGENVLLATDAGELWCIGPDGKPVWPQPAGLPYGPLAGAPRAAGDGLVLASTDGMVWRVDAATGEETSQLDVGRPLGAGPVPLGEQLLLIGHDGTLYQVKTP